MQGKYNYKEETTENPYSGDNWLSGHFQLICYQSYCRHICFFEKKIRMNGFFYDNFIPLNFREATCEYLMNAANF